MSEEILENINFVGYVDWSTRDFHSFKTSKGVTYNSYLVKDEKIALIDTVKEPFSSFLLDNIKKIVDPKSIDYIVVNHAEPDHSGALKEVLKKAVNAKVVCTQKCKNILSGYYDIDSWQFQIVKTGDELSLGNKTFEFIETPMLHWPDSMFTYLKEDAVLFSMDAFGQHYSSSARFDDEVDYCDLMEEAKKYYANIIMLYGSRTSAALEKLSGYEIKMIIPAHGVVWRKYISDIIERYTKWANFTPQKKVLVVYDSMWQSTKLMAEAIVQGAMIDGVEVKLIYTRASDLTHIATEVLDAAAIAFGSPTLNMEIMPSMGALFTYLKGLKPKNKLAACFGSYGWVGASVKLMEEKLKEMNFSMLDFSVESNWRPSQEDLQKCKELGKMLAEKVLAK